MKFLSPRQQTEYLELIREFPLIPIKSERHLLEAEKVIERFLDEKKLAGGARAYFEVLCDLVANYEDEHYPIPMASDADLLEHLLEAKGVTIAPLNLMIAAHALALDATLVSADQALLMIDILKVEDWSV